jgi:hypothetical protein
MTMKRKKLNSPPPPSRQSLASIPGQYLVEAMDQLPPCEAESTAQQLMIGVPFGGDFRVTFQPCKQTLDNWGTRWFWIPSHAESV